MMAKSIADVWGAQLVYNETTWGNSVLDLQSNKVDIAFALNPTPARALAIGFTRPYIQAPYGCLAKAGFNPKTVERSEQPRHAGSRSTSDPLHETCAKRFTLEGADAGPEDGRRIACWRLQSGRVDAHIIATTRSASALSARTRSLGPYHLLTGPLLVALPSNYGIQREPDIRFADVVNAWIDFNKGAATVREMMIDGLALNGVKPEQIPVEIVILETS